MSSQRHLLLLALLPALLVGEDAKAPSVRNSHMYPPAPAAAKDVNLDGSGFLLRGVRTFLPSGTIHYPRVPKELWRDRLTRLKRLGMTCVETYAFWNYHERREGQFDFTTEERDLEGFLTTAKEVGLYAIVRVGPYVCAEWNSGGFPEWLRHKDGVVVRTDNPQYLAYNDAWYQRIVPLVAKHQIHRGGNVILVQLENEHPQGWGVVKELPYFAHLHEVAVRLGIEVPMVMSGLNHGGSPAPSASYDPESAPTPWMSTEFWAGWFDRYGPLDLKKQRAIDSATWRIAAFGGGGYNYYMAHGGSNFASWSDDSTGASYDFGAMIGQTGDLRPSFYRTKRANQFGTSFSEALGAARSAKADIAITGAKGIAVRRGPKGTFTFFDGGTDPGEQPRTVTLPGGVTRRLAPSGLDMIAQDLVIDPEVTLAQSDLTPLGIARHGAALTLVLYGQPGEPGTVVLKGRGLAGASADGTLRIDLTVPANGLREQVLTLGTRELRLLAVSRDLSLRTWFIDTPTGQAVVVGPAYVRDLSLTGTSATVAIERLAKEAPGGQVAVYAGPGQRWHLADNAAASLPAAPALGSWQQGFSPEIDAAFDTASWIESATPPTMGSDGDDSYACWYRSTFSAPAAGTATFSIKAKDFARVFINGKLLEKDGAPVVAGTNTLTALVTTKGRNKAYSYTKRWDEFDQKGIVSITGRIQGATITFGPWRLHGGLDPRGVTTWKDPAPSGGAPLYARTHFTYHAAANAVPVLRVDTRQLSRGMIWLNGRAVGRYPDRIPVDGLWLPECWMREGTNELVIFDEEGADIRSVSLQTETAASRILSVATDPVPATTPFTVPPEQEVRDLVKLNQGNLAFRIVPTADGSPVPLVTDGDQYTTWMTKISTPALPLVLDLGAVTALGRIEIWWPNPSRQMRYTVEGSADGQTWTKLGDDSTAVPTSPDSPSEVSRLMLTGANAKQLRLTISGYTGRGNPGISEFKVFAP